MPSDGRRRFGSPQSIIFRSLVHHDLVQAALETMNRELAILIGGGRGHDLLSLANHDVRTGLRSTLRVDHLAGKHAARGQGNIADVHCRTVRHRRRPGRCRTLPRPLGQRPVFGDSDPSSARPTAVRDIQCNSLSYQVFFLHGILMARAALRLPGRPIRFPLADLSVPQPTWTRR